ncbi:MAG: hypothetical protein R3B09_17980 [Nannocystaceae bacterium]
MRPGLQALVGLQSRLQGPRGPLLLAVASAGAAALVLLPGLGGHGLWSESEVMALDRARAALGAALSGLERSAFLPDAVRTLAYRLVGAPEAIRIPGALASIALCGLTTYVGARRRLPPLYAMVAGAFALAFPLTLSQARLALGDPIGELLATVAAVALVAAGRRRGARSLALALAGGLALAASIACLGLVVGGVVPLLAVGLGLGLGESPVSQRRAKVAAAACVAGIVGLGGLALGLSLRQGTGFIPILAAARDLSLADRPELRGFTSTLQELGHQLFPWLPLALIGVLHPRTMRWPAMWLCASILALSTWSLVYGPSAIPVTLPAALCCAAGLESLASPTTTRPLRRLALLLTIGGVLVIGKDAKRTPGPIAAALAPPANERFLDATECGADVLLPRLSNLALLLLVLAGVAGGRRIARPWIAPAAALVILGHQAIAYGHGHLDRVSLQLSLRRPLDRWATWAAEGALPDALALSRIRDPGLELYGPPPASRQVAAMRAEILAWLRRPEPSAALIREGDLAPVFADLRHGGGDFFVLDRSHRDVLLVANVLPPGAIDDNPIREVLVDTPPILAHPTYVRWEDTLELIGWQLDGPVIRGVDATIVLAFRVLKAPPPGIQIHTRLQRGRLSRIGYLPHPVHDGLFPPNLWRPGDIIVDRFTFPVPVLEVLSGAHEVMIAIRVTPTKNMTISEPTGEVGELGVTVKGKQRHFATVGEVSVW